MEILHVMLKHPEVYTDLKFISIPTIQLELQVGIEKLCKDAKHIGANADDEDTLEDIAHIGIMSSNMCRSLNLPE